MEVRNRVIVVMSVMSIAILAFVAGPGLVSEDPGERQISFITIGFLAVVIGGTTLFVLKKQKQQFLSIVLIIDDGGVTCEQYTLPRVTIRASDILKIEKTGDGSILIQGPGYARIAVPSQMENYDQMIAMLATLKPITENKRMTWLRWIKN